MQVRDFLHAKPAELAATDSTRHVITAPIIHLDDVGGTSRARLDVVTCFELIEGKQERHFANRLFSGVIVQVISGIHLCISTKR